MAFFLWITSDFLSFRRRLDGWYHCGFQCCYRAQEQTRHGLRFLFIGSRAQLGSRRNSSVWELTKQPFCSVATAQKQQIRPRIQMHCVTIWFWPQWFCISGSNIWLKLSKTMRKQIVSHSHIVCLTIWAAESQHPLVDDQKTDSPAAHLSRKWFMAGTDHFTKAAFLVAFRPARHFRPHPNKPGKAFAANFREWKF